MSLVEQEIADSLEVAKRDGFAPIALDDEAGVFQNLPPGFESNAEHAALPHRQASPQQRPQNRVQTDAVEHMRERVRVEKVLRVVEGQRFR